MVRLEIDKANSKQCVQTGRKSKAKRKYDRSYGKGNFTTPNNFYLFFLLLCSLVYLVLGSHHRTTCHVPIIWALVLYTLLISLLQVLGNHKSSSKKRCLHKRQIAAEIIGIQAKKPPCNQTRARRPSKVSSTNMMLFWHVWMSAITHDPELVMGVQLIQSLVCTNIQSNVQ